MQPKIWLCFPGTCDIRYFRNNYFWLPGVEFNDFYHKIVSAQRNTHSIQIVHTVPPNNWFLEGNFYLCVENVMRVLDPFFPHTRSWCRSFLHI